MPVGESSSAAYDCPRQKRQELVSSGAALSYNTYPVIAADFWHLADKQVGLIAVVDKKKPVIVIY